MERRAHVSAKCERVVKNSLQAVTKRGTIVSNMSTIIKTDSLSATLFGKTRRAVLALLYSHVDESFYIRQIARTAGVGLGAVREAHHYRVIQSLAHTMKADAGLIVLFDQFRKKRNISGYDHAGMISRPPFRVVIIRFRMLFSKNGFKEHYRYNNSNIHPALLPSFPGVDGYGDTFRYGCKVGGCTVHFVDYGEDSGPIIRSEGFSY
ncbi:MAG: phosphoribosylglycinamide formyltransferase 1 [Desulfobacteraceae bacterium Eth-SRB1]|nr:MAG: phosphoribosylglycinamide formyltransferase 1 [Desulfobacteraceae bacterium Eth-SRB1]